MSLIRIIFIYYVSYLFIMINKTCPSWAGAEHTGARDELKNNPSTQSWIWVHIRAGHANHLFQRFFRNSQHSMRQRHGRFPIAMLPSSASFSFLPAWQHCQDTAKPPCHFRRTFRWLSTRKSPWRWDTPFLSSNAATSKALRKDSSMQLWYCGIRYTWPPCATQT